MSKKDVSEHLEEIRRQLWLGHASLMVGSGFSKNAVITNGAPCPPNWDELAAAFIKKLYPISNDDKNSLDKHNKEILSKKSVLQLAEEFETTFQRPALNELLKEYIQDDNLFPGALHEALMNLPWVDIFTTNYDTLLERAAKNIINIKYDVVYKSNNLPHSESPRIIKLHGSFPLEENPLIITEEDYRTYPEKYSPFVNTVQQAIMESTMCLIGFSGTDPNFLKWIGWVKDNLHDSMPPIYLIGLLKLSDTERKVLETKKIIPVDLSEWDNSDSLDYPKILEKFCSFLEVKPSCINWQGYQQDTFSYPSQDLSSNQIIEIIKLWKQQREEYPNWLYLSWQKRSNMYIFTEPWTYNISYLKNLPDDWDIRGLYELNWRLEKLLIPIPHDLVESYNDILEKYDCSKYSDEKYKIDNELKQIWLELCFAMLRWSRETLNDEVWKRYEMTIKENIGNNQYFKNQLFYECVSYAMAVPDLEKIDKLIQQWDKIAHPLIWKVKYASILAELGEINNAIQLWTEALNELRPHIPKSKIKDDFYLLGVEGCILVNLSMADTYRRYYLQILNNKDNKQRIIKSKEDNDDIQKKYRERLRELNQYDCNPWDNIEKFSLVIKNTDIDDNYIKTYRKFDKIETFQSYYNGWKPEIVYACQILRFFEETGIALHVGNVNIADKTLVQALPCIADIYPYRVFSILNRIGTNNEKGLELCFSQKKVYQIKTENVNKLLENLIKQFLYIINNKDDHLRYIITDFYKSVLKNLYELISRLTVKASIDNLKKILTIGLLLYNLDISKKYFFEKNGSCYFSRLFMAMTPEQIFQNLNEILSIKIPLLPKHDWQPPVNIDWRGYKLSTNHCSRALSQTIDSLIEQLDNSNEQYRFFVLLYLNTCISINILTKKQKNNIAVILYKYIHLDGKLPKDDFYKFVYLYFLEPLNKKIDIKKIMFNYYLESSKSFFHIQKDTISTPLGETSFIIMAKSLLMTCSIFNSQDRLYFDISENENAYLFQQLKSTWDNQKQYILNYLSSKSQQHIAKSMINNEINDNIFDTFVYLDKILAEIIIPRANKKGIENKIINFINEIEQYIDLPCSDISQFAKTKYIDYNRYINKSISAFMNYNIRNFDLYAYSLFNAYRFISKKRISNIPDILISTLINTIGMKSDPCFKSACSIVGSIFSFYEPDKTMCEMLLIYLKELKEQTDFNSTSNRFELSDRYDYRQAAMFLATKLYYVYVSRNETIPSILEEWKQIGQSNEEFPSVRNTWLREQYRNMQK